MYQTTTTFSSCLNCDCRSSPSGCQPLDQPIDLSHKPACRQPVNYSHHRRLLLLSPKADTHFTIPRRLEGWVCLDGWPHTPFCSTHMLWQWTNSTCRDGCMLLIRVASWTEQTGSKAQHWLRRCNGRLGIPERLQSPYVRYTIIVTYNM